ncbi:hypothetical protein LTR85_011205 [Meristemomyces frigidus]|nr:hypothetical protein LTR85_011205 [Meristemomyces frigidus]
MVYGEQALGGSRDEWPHAMLKAFLESRWFTRGWTLQELLAPSYVMFFAQDWTILGPLRDLLSEVSQATSIPRAVLSHEQELSECSIAQRLSWASYRATSRIEDTAYSLLGILGIHMPLLYGENVRAFSRLQEEILKTSSDLSVLAWTHVDQRRRSHLLASSPRDFARCGDIVRGQRVSDVAEHWWMTNKGLTGTLSVWEEYPQKLALLGCCYQRAPQDILGLRLVAFLPGGDAEVDAGLPGDPRSVLSRLEAVPPSAQHLLRGEGITIMRRGKVADEFCSEPGTVAYLTSSRHRSTGIHIVKDSHGTVSRTREGPLSEITDPSLQKEHIYASMMILGSPDIPEGIDPSLLYTAASDTSECLDYRFSIRRNPRSFFQLGRVFGMILLLRKTQSRDSSGVSTITQERYDDFIRSGVKFVVIRDGHSYCSALSISTYGNRGAAARGIILSEHGIIHTGKQPPQPLPAETPSRGEKGMCRTAVRVAMNDPGGRLPPLTRINYGKVFTIQHNVKVNYLGNTLSRSTGEMVRQFREVWLGKEMARDSDQDRARCAMQAALLDRAGQDHIHDNGTDHDGTDHDGTDDDDTDDDDTDDDDTDDYVGDDNDSYDERTGNGDTGNPGTSHRH